MADKLDPKIGSRAPVGESGATDREQLEVTPKDSGGQLDDALKPKLELFGEDHSQIGEGAAETTQTDVGVVTGGQFGPRPRDAESPHSIHQFPGHRLETPKRELSRQLAVLLARVPELQQALPDQGQALTRRWERSWNLSEKQVALDRRVLQPVLRAWHASGAALRAHASQVLDDWCTRISLP